MLARVSRSMDISPGAKGRNSTASTRVRSRSGTGHPQPGPERLESGRPVRRELGRQLVQLAAETLPLPGRGPDRGGDRIRAVLGEDDAFPEIAAERLLVRQDEGLAKTHALVRAAQERVLAGGEHDHH